MSTSIKYLDQARADYDAQREAARNADPGFYQKLADARQKRAAG
jgi:hypothetical protein